MQQEDFDIIHLHGGGNGDRLQRWLARRVSRAAFVLHLHGRVSESDGPQPVSLHTDGADAVIAACEATASCTVGARPRVIYFGVDAPENGLPFRPRRSAPGPVLGTAARLVPIKGISYLLRALALVLPEFPQLKLQLAGSGPERRALEAQARQFGIADRVEFLGWQPEIHQVMAAWDIFVLPSLDEGFPLALLDAMSVGLPVVASAAGGIPELVVDGQTGWLVPPARPEALAERIAFLLRNSELARSMGQAGRARIQREFFAARMVKDISGIYDSLLQDRALHGAV